MNQFPDLPQAEEEYIALEPERKINSLEDATRYAYGLSKTREEIAKINKIADDEVAKWQERIDQVNRWREEVTKPLQDKADAISHLLTIFHIEEYNNADDKRKKDFISIKLPYGVTLASRQQADKLDVVDEEAYLAYATENDLLKPPAPPEVRWSDLKKKLVVKDGAVVNKETGEVVPFIKATPQERKFEVK